MVLRMKSFNTMIGATGLALAAASAAQAQDGDQDRYAVTRECAIHALQEVFTDSVKIIETPNGYAGTLAIEKPEEGDSRKQSALIGVEPDGLIKFLNVQMDLLDTGQNYQGSASLTLNYEGDTPTWQRNEQSSMFLQVPVSYSLHRLDDELRACKTLLLSGGAFSPPTFG